MNSADKDFNDRELEAMDDLNDFVVLTDEDGRDSQVELVDRIKYKGSEYLFMIPVNENSSDDDSAEAVILLVEKNPDGTKSYTTVVTSIVDELFEIFKERCKDRFDFE